MFEFHSLQKNSGSCCFFFLQKVIKVRSLMQVSTLIYPNQEGRNSQSEKWATRKKEEDNCVQLGIKRKAAVTQHCKPCVGKLSQYVMFTTLKLRSSELREADTSKQCISQNGSKCMSDKHNDYIDRNRMSGTKHCWVNVMHQMKRVHGVQDHTGHLMATDRRSSIHRLKAHMMGDRSQCKSQSSGNRDESGTQASQRQGI